MIICNTIDKYDIHYFHNCDPIKNSIITNGKFYRLLYSSKNFTMNNIYCILNYNSIKYEKIDNQKHKYKLNFLPETILHIKHVEEQLLKKINCNNARRPQLKITEQLSNDYVKILDCKLPAINNLKVLLKISGIWENESQCGLTFKIIICNA
jgi:hypothetical protein